jgi:hypothetical protein
MFDAGGTSWKLCRLCLEPALFAFIRGCEPFTSGTKARECPCRMVKRKRAMSLLPSVARSLLWVLSGARRHARSDADSRAHPGAGSAGAAPGPPAARGPRRRRAGGRARAGAGLQPGGSIRLQRGNALKFRGQLPEDLARDGRVRMGRYGFLHGLCNRAKVHHKLLGTHHLLHGD